MNIAKRKLSYLAIVGALGLTACGGGGGGATNATQDSTVTGVITGFGSVFIDGVEYETDDSTFTIDGIAGTEDDLDVGMVITLTGTVNPDGSTGFASNIVFSNELEGVVIANNYATDGTLNIMGQTIKVDAATVFESKVATITTIDQIAAGNIVEISGHSTGTGTIYATRLEVKKETKEMNDTIEVKGVVSNLNSSAQTFDLGNLTVDYSSAMLDDITNLANGLYVEVKSTQALNGSTMVASKVELEDDGSFEHEGDDGEEMEFEGVIVSVGDDSSFVVNGQTVFYNNFTEVEHGTLNDLVVDAKVKVEGEFDSNGKLIAEEIEFKVHGELELSGYIDAIDSAGNTITVMGNILHLGNNTIMLDERDEGVDPERYFNLADLSTNDWVEVHYYYDSSTDSHIATKFERDDDDESSDSNWSVEGLVESIDTNTKVMVISGISIDFSAFPSFNVSVGAEVEVEGSFNGGILTATEIEIEDLDS